MKRILFALVTGIALQAAGPASGVLGTMHDMNTRGVAMVNAARGTTSYQTCVYCHAPHTTAAVSQLVPLWNHTTSTNTTFTMYTAANAKSEASMITGTVDSSPNGVSLACISCHDGSVAIGSVVVAPYGSAAVYTANTSIDANGKLINHNVGVGGDFTNDHPISVTYDAVADKGLVTPDASVLAGVFGGKNITTVGTYLPLFSGQVQCASCHDVHNWSLSPKTGKGGTPFLRIDNGSVSGAGSALCTTCHKK
jgi:hypothetical protein